jgi:transcription antitermination factor NusG
MKDRKRWYALYTKPRWEKKVHQLLAEQGFEAYCPLNKVRRQWSDRIKLVEEPLFKSYLFVRVAEPDLLSVRMTSGVINFVYWNGKPGVVKDREIDTIRRFLNEHEGVTVQPASLLPGQKVIINSGAFMNSFGEVLEVKHKKIIVHIKSLGVNLCVIGDKDRLAVV